MDKFYKGKNVFITGHTGFKGSWLSRVLIELQANVSGYSLKPPTDPSLFEALELEKEMKSAIGDIRDLEKLKNALKNANPDIVIHMAAQPLVIESYKNPVYTYETNVIGTVNILEAVRECENVKSFLNVTTDKVYQNNEWDWGYRETDSLNGYDPYSNSKSCSELVTDSYRKSFFSERNISISTARAGNVIGGCDFSDNRIIPDCIKYAFREETIKIRNPYSIRPYQHVLEPIFVYLLIAEKQYENKAFSGAYNVGPDERDCVTTKKLVEIFCEKWGNNQKWESTMERGYHEANFLKLDCSKIKNRTGWTPVWNVEKAVEKTIEMYKAYYARDIDKCILSQIREFYDEFINLLDLD